MASSNCRRGKLILELKRAMNLGASSFLGGKTKIHAVMRFEALSHTAETILDMGNNPVWNEEIFSIDLNGCSDDTLVKIEIYKDESKLIGSLVLTVLQLCVMEGVTYPRILPLITARGKPHGEVEILTTYLSLEHHASSGPSDPLPPMGDFQPTAPAWDLPFVPDIPDVCQEPNADCFQNQHPSKVQEPDHEPPNAQLPKAPTPSQPTVDPFYAYF